MGEFCVYFQVSGGKTYRIRSRMILKNHYFLHVSDWIRNCDVIKGYIFVTSVADDVLGDVILSVNV